MTHCETYSHRITGTSKAAVDSDFGFPDILGDSRDGLGDVNTHDKSGLEERLSDSRNVLNVGEIVG